MTSEYKKSNPILTGTWVPENLAENNKKTNKTYNIIIKDLLLDALIGIHAHEKDKKQKVLINLLLKASDSFKVHDDDITNVVSYEYIVNDIELLINSGHFGLLETLAEKISKICLKDERVLNVTIKIEKLDVFKNARSVGIEIYRENKKKKSLKKIGKNFDLSNEDMNKCLKDEEIETKILNERISAQKNYEISSTPTIYINEKKYEGQHEYQKFKKELEKFF